MKASLAAIHKEPEEHFPSAPSEPRTFGGRDQEGHRTPAPERRPWEHISGHPRGPKGAFQGSGGGGGAKHEAQSDRGKPRGHTGGGQERGRAKGRGYGRRRGRGEGAQRQEEGPENAKTHRVGTFWMRPRDTPCVGAFSHSARTARAQCAHSANYYGDYPGNNPENHPPCGIMHNQFNHNQFPGT